MFGYIAPRLDQLTDEQKHRYRACYCGLCQCLHESSGSDRRFFLSNDMTFLAILLSSLYDLKETEQSKHCLLHPVRKQNYVQTRLSSYAADMNLLLMYWKMEDRIMDDRSILGKMGKHRLEPSLERIAQIWPIQTSGVQESLTAIWKEEKKDHPDPDLLCNLSGRMLGYVFVPDPEDFWASELYALGAGLGRFVYWMDAWEDLKDDQKHHRFNPLEPYLGRKDYQEFVQYTLEMLIAEAAEHFELLPLEKDLDILRNVLYSGVWQRYYTLLQHNHKENADVQ